MLVTPEPRPLDVFGSIASDSVARLLDRAGVEFVGDTVADSVVDDALAHARRADASRRTP